MLNRLKSEVKALKAGRTSGEKVKSKTQLEPERKCSKPRAIDARAKLHEIEMMLVEAEDSTQWLQERLERIKIGNDLK